MEKPLLTKGPYQSPNPKKPRASRYYWGFTEYCYVAAIVLWGGIFIEFVVVSNTLGASFGLAVTATLVALLQNYQLKKQGKVN